MAVRAVACTAVPLPLSVCWWGSIGANRAEEAGDSRREPGREPPRAGGDEPARRGEGERAREAGREEPARDIDLAVAMAAARMPGSGEWRGGCGCGDGVTNTPGAAISPGTDQPLKAWPLSPGMATLIRPKGWLASGVKSSPGLPVYDW